jgi:hypothetical protein
VLLGAVRREQIAKAEDRLVSDGGLGAQIDARSAFRLVVASRELLAVDGPFL